MKAEVRFSEVDSSLRYNLISLSQLIQDATTNYLSAYRISNDYINPKYQRILVVLRNRLLFLAPLKLHDQLVAEVRLVRKSLAFFVLETDVYRKSDRKLSAKSYVELCTIDMKKRTVTPLSQLSEYQNMPLEIEEKRNDFFPKWSYPYGNEYEKKVSQVKSTDIDYSKHLNNIAYFRYLLNCFPSSLLEYMTFREAEITYIKEALEGEELSIYYMVEDKTIYFLVKHDKDVLTKARILFSYE